MRFKINFELEDGTKDYIIIEGETIQEIRERADKEVQQRCGFNCCSERL